MTPSLRRPLGILGLFAAMLVYALVAVRVLDGVAALHPLLQAPIWLVVGLAWVLPVKPLLIWIETGRWR